MKKIAWIVLIVSAFLSLNAKAQCKINNTFFQAGEELTYDLYFKYGLINTKAGTACGVAQPLQNWYRSKTKESKQCFAKTINKY